VITARPDPFLEGGALTSFCPSHAACQFPLRARMKVPPGLPQVPLQPIGIGVYAALDFMLVDNFYEWDAESFSGFYKTEMTWL